MLEENQIQINILDELINNNKSNTIIFIDGSYYCFYRYFSLLTWWKNAHSEEKLEDPYQNSVFLEKFKKLFVENIQTIPKNLKLDKNIQPILIVGKDCKRENIWRNKHFDKYKANRETTIEDGFMGGPFFKMAYEEKLFNQAGVKAVLKHPQLEADDCIALSIKYITNKYPDMNIFVITSDKDYLQIASDKVKLYSLLFKNLSEQKSSHGDPKKDLFCKIVSGDPSDSIPSVFKKCGPKTALKYFNDPDLFNKKLNEDPEAKIIYERNKKIIDFNEIPTELVEEFMNSIAKTQ